MAKFAGQNVHKRLVTEESYQSKAYDAALKRAFLGTDEDIRASELLRYILRYVHSQHVYQVPYMHETRRDALPWPH